MVQQRFGDLHVFADAVRDNPRSPDVRAYLETMGLAEEELSEVLERFNQFCRAIDNAASQRLPEIAAEPA
jgi:hypothetical protein